MDTFPSSLVGKTVAVGAALATAGLFTLVPAHAGPGDSDGDGIPNRWERSHGLNPNRAADALTDLDKDGLRNLGEFRHGGTLRDEDTDDDGHDDGDEVRDGRTSTDIDEADTDEDGTLDGDEDANRDGEDNEDEDDAAETCRADDDDDDSDHVDDEDENELDLKEGDSDSDDDGTLDGDEDADEDGEANEDMDDALEDSCERNGGEDLGDVLGTIAGFDSATGTLTIDSRAVGTVWFKVTADTEIEVDGSDEDGSTADLVPGTLVAEVDVDDETGALEEIELYVPGMDPDEI